MKQYYFVCHEVAQDLGDSSVELDNLQKYLSLVKSSNKTKDGKKPIFVLEPMF